MARIIVSVLLLLDDDGADQSQRMAIREGGDGTLSQGSIALRRDPLALTEDLNHRW